MKRKQFSTVTDYLIDAWGEKNGLDGLRKRYNASDEFLAGWLTAMTTRDRDVICFPPEQLANTAQIISDACKKFMQ